MKEWNVTTVRHRQYNAIVTQTTGVIKYLVSDSVKEKGTIVKRKKPLVHVWSVCEELALKYELASVKKSTFPSNPSAKFSGYGPGFYKDLCVFT